MAEHQIRASNTRSQPAPSRAGAPAQHLLDVEELTVLTAWGEAAAEALAHAPERASAVFSEARAGATWRQALGLTEPSQQVDAAIDRMDKAVHAALQPGNPRTLEQLAGALRANMAGEQDLDGLVRRVLVAMIEERGTRQPHQSSAPFPHLLDETTPGSAR